MKDQLIPNPSVEEPRVRRLGEADALFFRGQLRAGRAGALADSEDFYDLLSAFERLGAYLAGETRVGFGKYRAELLDLIGPAEAPQARAQLSAAEIFELVRLSRNDALHSGAYARNLTSNAVRLAILLEGALMAAIQAHQVKHFMVDSPVCAELWHPLGLARHTLLSTSFSYLPIRTKAGDWKLLSDRAIATYVRRGTAADKSGDEERKRRLDQQIEAALAAAPPLALEDAICVHPEQPINDVLAADSNGRPFLVFQDGKDQLVGILTAFDLL